MIEYIASCKSMGQVPEGARLVSVNGRDVVAICEHCGKPVYGGSEYTSWADGPYTHKRCPRFKKQAEEAPNDDA